MTVMENKTRLNNHPDLAFISLFKGGLKGRLLGEFWNFA
jgi:hypothetical protein